MPFIANSGVKKSGNLVQPGECMVSRQNFLQCHRILENVAEFYDADLSLVSHRTWLNLQ